MNYSKQLKNTAGILTMLIGIVLVLRRWLVFSLEHPELTQTQVILQNGVLIGMGIICAVWGYFVWRAK